MATFRRPHDYRPALGVIAVLFPVGVADEPPLRQPMPIQAAHAAYRPAHITPTARYSPPIQVLDYQATNFPFALNAQEAAKAGYRAPYVAVPIRQPQIIDILDFQTEDAAVGQGDIQQLAAIALRPAWTVPNRIVPSADLFQALAAEQPQAVAYQSLAHASYRTAMAVPYSLPSALPAILGPYDEDPINRSASQKSNNPAFQSKTVIPPPTLFPAAVFGFVQVDEPPLSSVAVGAAQAAYRTPHQIQTQRINPAGIFNSLGDDPLWVIPVQQMAGNAYRDGIPRAVQRFNWEPIFENYVDPVPMDRPASQQMAANAYRAPFSRAATVDTSLLLYPPPVVDPPPLARPAAQAMAQAAYVAPFSRSQGPDARALFIPSNDDPPLSSTAQASAQAAYRPVGSPQRIPLALSVAVFPQVLDAVPLRSNAQDLAQAAYRPPFTFGAGVLPANLLHRIGQPDDPPLVSVAQLAAHSAYRPAWTRAGHGPDPFSVFDLPDVPPLLSGAQMAGHTAYRQAGQPQRIPPILSSAVFPPVLDAPPLQSSAQMAARLAFRIPEWPVMAAQMNRLRPYPQESADPAAFHVSINTPIYISVSLDTPIQEGT